MTDRPTDEPLDVDVTDLDAEPVDDSAGEPGPHHVDGPNAEPDGEPEPVETLPALRAEQLPDGPEPSGDEVADRFDIALAHPGRLADSAREQRPAVQADAGAALDRIATTAAKAVAGFPERIDPSEAVRLVMLFDARESAFQEAGHVQRFLLGVVARRVSEVSRYADKAMERLAEASGVNVNVIRQTRRLAERYRDSPEQFARWLKAIRRETGKPARWYHVERLIGTFSDPSVLGPDELARRIVSEVERAAERAGLIAGHEAEEGVAIILTDTARSIRHEGLARLAEVEHTPDTTPRDPIYLRFVAKLPCAATHVMPPDGGWDPTFIGNDAHHIGTGGTAIKGSDYTAVPLCREAHDFLHQNGYAAFRKRWNVDLLEVMYQTLHLYVAEQEAFLPSGLLASR